MERKTLLFPSSYFSINRVDEDMQAEYDSAIATGLFDKVLHFRNSLKAQFHRKNLIPKWRYSTSTAVTSIQAESVSRNTLI